MGIFRHAVVFKAVVIFFVLVVEVHSRFSVVVFGFGVAQARS